MRSKNNESAPTLRRQHREFDNKLSKIVDRKTKCPQSFTRKHRYDINCLCLPCRKNSTYLPTWQMRTSNTVARLIFGKSFGATSTFCKWKKNNYLFVIEKLPRFKKKRKRKIKRKIEANYERLRYPPSETMTNYTSSLSLIFFKLIEIRKLLHQSALSLVRLCLYAFVFAFAFVVDASEAGEGQLEISINEGEVPNHVTVVGGGRCLVSFTPEQAKPHLIDIKFNGESVLGGCSHMAI